MKKIFLLWVVLLLAFTAQSQTTASVAMGTGYANEVFWKMQNGNAGQAAINSWDLAFRIGLQNSSIFINSANGVSLYQVPNTDISGWSTLDTVGLHTWHQLFNSDTSWEFGAFDRSTTVFPDFGWGVYDMATHVVNGDSLFIIKLGNSIYKKLWIVKKDFGNWTFRYADLDNSNDQTVTINGADYPDKNFAYFSLSNGTSLNLEPNTSDWDVLFTRYVTLLPPDNTPYLVTGVLSNTDISVARAEGVDVNSVDATTYGNNYVDNISTIGYDWKYFDMNAGQYAIVDSLCYFIKLTDGNIYKLVFTEFEGSSTGVISWEQTNLISSISNLNHSLSAAAIYPNPVKGRLNVVFDMKRSVDELQVFLNDIDGREVYHSAMSANYGINQQSIALPELPNGLYLLRLASGDDALQLKVIIAN